ncbi:MAG: phospholipase D family protein [Pseudomonadota bacterium]|jgi:hypothetical protein
MKFLSENIWPTITEAIRSARGPSYIAVAYVGQDAARLLPVKNRSVVVVDCSEKAVKSGQTCPKELIKLRDKRGARIFSAKDLHAKVFVCGRSGFIGSANASNNSADNLQEAVLRISEAAVLNRLKSFVTSIALDELGPEELKRLAKIYRRPKGSGVRKVRKKKSGSKSRRISVSKVRLEHLTYGDIPETIDEALKDARKQARTFMKRPRHNKLDQFHLSGRVAIKPGEIIVQLVEDSGKQVWALPPGRVIHVDIFKESNRVSTLVYLEQIQTRRRKLERLAAQLGYGAKKQLRHDGIVSQEFGAQLLGAFASLS